jgi:putative salt-induced outer membrane protein YdiY
MVSFVVESYASEGAVDEQQDRARLAAELGPGVRYIRTTFLPGDETVFHAFEAESADALRWAIEATALPFDRIVEAVEAAATSIASNRGLER